MEVDESGVPEACPEIVAPFWSQLTLSWVSPFCKLVSNSKQQSLRASQLWPLPPRESPEAICSAFQKAWKEKNQERVTSKRQRVLARVLWHLSWRPFAVASVFMFLYYPFSASTPLVVRSLISFVSIHKNADADPPPLWHGVALVVLLVLCTSTQQLGILQYFYRCSRTGVALRAALCQAIMSKALRLPSGTIDNGEVCTLMSNDAERILVAAPFLQYIWAIPVQVVSVMLLLWSEVGSASLGGVAVLLLLMPIQAKISHWASRLRRQQLKITSLRVQTLGEALSLMRGLLLTSWDEEVFNHLVLLRRSELSFVARSLLLKGLNAALLFTTPVIVALVTFSLYSHVVSNDGISVVVAYTTLGYFSLLRWPLAMLPKVVSGLAEAWVSIERLEHFLLMDEHLPISEISTVDGIAVCIDHCDLGWNSSPRLLQDLCCQVPVGSLALILGPVGCGKSTFLLAIAGECPKQRGSLSRLKSIGLVTAQPWLVNASVRENILVGRGFEPTWYQAVLKACSLTVDLLGWDKGDATLLGERGQAISGGQRQRIALARACYGKPDLALLDDPVSALDPPTGASVWQQVVLGLLANSTRIVATSRPDSTSDADMCLVLSRGSLLREEAAQNELERLTKALVAVGETAEAESVDKQIVPALQPRTQIFQEETKRSGRVGMNVWRCWTRNCGLGSVPMLVGLFLLCQAGCTMADYFLGKWAESHDDREPYNDRESGTSAWMFAWVFVSIATMLLTMLRASLFMRGSVRTAKILHEHALRRVFEAPIGWFEATPTGRTLNRFGRDLDMIDSLLPPFVEDACVRITEIIGVLVLVMVIAPVAILPSLVVLWFMVRLHRAIQPAIIETKRLDGVLASPMYTAFSDMLVGIEVIRTSRLEDLWIERHISSLEPYSRATFMHHACNRYFGMRLCALSNVVLGSTALVSVMLVRLDLPTVSAVSVGLLLVYSMQLSFAFSALMQQAVEAENNLSAVERVHDCAVEEDVLKYRFEKCIRPHESAAATSVGHCWPTNGAMLFSDLYVSYSIKDQLHQCVLRGVSFQVDSGECIGIVGRSGSGKSSLLAAIFGMAHVAKGTISIDGVDLATVPVALVRKRLAMIPQQPVIFSGTIRSNLVRECTDVLDEKLWNVLAAVGLHDTFRTLGKGLDSDVGIAGNSLSSGQQQLLSLARALLRNCPILVLDEATSHVDATTEQTFKTVLRGPQLSEAKSTVISVAHRPESLTVADRIIHVVDGQIRQVAQSSQVASI